MSLRAIMADAWDSSAGVRCVALCLALVVATLTSGPAAAEKRVALVIGNGAYTDDEDVVVGDGANGLVLLGVVPGFRRRGGSRQHGQVGH